MCGKNVHATDSSLLHYIENIASSQTSTIFLKFLRLMGNPPLVKEHRPYDRALGIANQPTGIPMDAVAQCAAGR